MAVKIISFDSVNGSVEIKWEDGMPPLNVELPINENGEYIVGGELDVYLNGFVPAVDTARKQALSNGVPNASVIEAMVQPEVAPIEAAPADVSDIVNQAEQDMFDASVKESLVRLGVL